MKSAKLFLKMKSAKLFLKMKTTKLFLKMKMKSEKYKTVFENDLDGNSYVVITK